MQVFQDSNLFCTILLTVLFFLIKKIDMQSHIYYWCVLKHEFCPKLFTLQEKKNVDILLEDFLILLNLIFSTKVIFLHLNMKYQQISTDPRLDYTYSL